MQHGNGTNTHWTRGWEKSGLTRPEEAKRDTLHTGYENKTDRQRHRLDTEQKGRRNKT